MNWSEIIDYLALHGRTVAFKSSKDGHYVCLISGGGWDSIKCKSSLGVKIAFALALEKVRRCQGFSHLHLDLRVE